MTPFPIILFAYNRPDHLRLTIESLRQNRGAADCDLFVFSDGPKSAAQAGNVEKVRAYLRSVGGFKSVRITERERNMGLAASVIAGVSHVLDQHQACIVMEDDMVSAPGFLEFMNAALHVYRGREDIFSVTGYNYPLPIPENHPQDAYLSYRGSSWGWGTWANRWRTVDWTAGDFAQFVNDADEQALFARGGDDLFGILKAQMAGKIDSWSIRFDYAHYKHNAFCLHAVKSKIQNIGFDGSGVHCGTSAEFAVELDSSNHPLRLPPDLQPDPAILKIFDDRFRPRKSAMRSAASFLTRAARRVRRIAHDNALKTP